MRWIVALVACGLARAQPLKLCKRMGIEIVDAWREVKIPDWCQKLDLTTLTAREAVTEAAKVVYTQHDPAKDKPIELEISWVCDESNRLHQLVPPELHAAAEAAAKAHRESMDDD